MASGALASGCKAVWCSFGPVPPYEIFICRHCKDQVGFVVPGKKERGQRRSGAGIGAVRCVGGCLFRGFSVFEAEVPQFQTDNEASIAFVL